MAPFLKFLQMSLYSFRVIFTGVTVLLRFGNYLFRLTTCFAVKVSVVLKPLTNLTIQSSLIKE